MIQDGDMIADHKVRILRNYGISGADHLASGMEAEVYALSQQKVLKLYTQTASFSQLTTLQHFYNALDPSAVDFSLPAIEQLSVDEGIVISIEKRLHGKRLSDLLPTLESVQLEWVMRRYLSTVTDVPKILLPAIFDRYKLFDDDGISNRSASDWHRFLQRYLANKLEQLRLYFERDVTHFAIKWACINQLLSQPYAGDYRLIHGDFFPGNLLVDESLQTTALLDFGMMTMVGDPLFDVATAWVLFDMYNELKQDARDRLLPILLERLGEDVRGKLYRYVLIYSLLTANSYSPTCEDGHYAWCVANLNEDELWQRVD